MKVKSGGGASVEFPKGAEALGLVNGKREKREEGEVPPDVPVVARINPERAVETTIVDLEIVVGVTPGTDTVR